MQRFILPLLLYVMFLFQGNLMHKLIPTIWQTHVIVAPNFMLIIILFIGIYINRHWAMAYGFAFGMLHDIVYYGPMLGPYSFGMGLAGYLIGMLSLQSKKSLFKSLLFIIFGDFLFEVVIYGINRLFLLIHTDFNYVLSHQILPSMLVNLLFAMLVYIPLRKLLEFIETDREKDEDDSFN